MKEIQFVRTELYESEGRNKGPTFEEGSVHKFEDAFADRWLRRGAAVPFTGKGAVVAAKAGRGGDDGGAKDGLDLLTVKQLQAKAEELKVDLGKVTKKDEIIALLRAPKAEEGDQGSNDGLDASTDDELLEIVEAESIDAGEATDRDEIIAAIRTARQAAEA